MYIFFPGIRSHYCLFYIFHISWYHLKMDKSVKQGRPFGHLNDKFNDCPSEVLKNSGNHSSHIPESKSGPTPPPSGTSSKSVPKNSSSQASTSIETMFETFHQASTGEFKPTFYNPFEVRHRRRTSRSQFKTLERAFSENCKPTSQVRKQLAHELNMSIRSIQVWFQNRRAKLKTMLKNGKMTDKQMMEYLSSSSSQNQHHHHHHQQEQAGGSESENQDSPSSFEDSDASDSESASEAKNDSIHSSIAFNSQKRTFPAVVINESAAVACNSDTMPYGNSYPNQARNRSYSLPAIQRSPQLPFKQLQEALFGQPQPATAALTSLNAFQHYLRASNAVMSQVSNNNNNQNNNNAGYYSTPQSISIPQLTNFSPLTDYNNNQVDPSRLRPRSSSFAVPSTHNSRYQNDILSMIKEDSPISEYMNLSNPYEQQQQQQQHRQHGYYDGNDSEIISNQINSLDLDYFMATNGHDGGGYDHSHPNSSSASSILSSSIHESPINNSNSDPSNLNLHNFINELDFLPQPTNEILLSTLIGDEHFLQ